MTKPTKKDSEAAGIFLGGKWFSGKAWVRGSNTVFLGVCFAVIIGLTLMFAVSGGPLWLYSVLVIGILVLCIAQLNRWFEKKQKAITRSKNIKSLLVFS